MFRFTIRDVLWFTVVIAVALAIYFVRPRQVRWEYRIEAGFGTNSLNAVGAEGWELTAIEPSSEGITMLYFKRPK